MSNLDDLRKKFVAATQQPQPHTQPQQQQNPSSVLKQQLHHQICSGLDSRHHLPLTSALSVGATPLNIPTTTTVIGTSDPERLYIFPPATTTAGNSSRVGPSDAFGPAPNAFLTPLEQQHISRGHSRSVSHGGGTFIGSNSSGIGGTAARPLKSAMKGHQRAFSHGQITDTATVAQAPRSGHTRVGSKTDFILPPTHKDIDENRIGEFGSSAASSARGHSRQASRSESIYTLRRTEIPPWYKRFGLCQNDKFEERGYRIVVPNHTVPPKTPKSEHPNGLYVGNKIRTTKYTLLSFIPKNLLEQFHRVANLYFIFIVLLNWFPAINAFGKEIAMIPVLFVLGVTAIKDLFEDRRRRASDQRINNSTCRVYNGESERYKKVLWQEIRVGDLVHLSNNETVPADMLLLRTSDPHGICYIDTCDLDGETNLKRREVVRGFTEKQHIFTPSKFVSRVEADAPTTKIYRFHGALIHPSGERVPLSTESLLLRESRLKNTDFIEGIVVYAGHETKSMLNNSGPRYKRSQLEQQMNIDVIWCVIILLLLCVIGAVGCKMWLSTFEYFPVPYLPFEVEPNYEGLLTFWTFIIILQVMIPLSLYVTIEFCKILQVYHIHNNKDLFDHDTNKKTECRAMNITEELGQVQHIFSDKTGTLTENKMLFRRCTINGIDYNHPPSELEKIYSKPGSPAPPLIVNQNLLNELEHLKTNCQFYTQNAQRIQEFFVVLAICNTVVVSATPHRDSMNASGVIETQIQENNKTSTSTTTTAIVDNDSEDGLSGTSSRTTMTTNSTAPILTLNLNTNCVATSNDNNLKVTNTNSLIPVDRYTRLTESRSITPSPPPNCGYALPTQNHIPSLSPISSSAESSPTTESPPMKLKNILNTSSPSGRARTIINSKLTTITSFLNAKGHAKRLANKLKNTIGQRGFKKLVDGRPIFEAESPDELALVNAAYSYDCCLLNRSPNHILVNVPGSGILEYEVLKILPFDSHRKCMSVVVRKTGSQEIILYTKGADTSIMPCLSHCLPDSSEGILREKTQQQLDLYAREGLRVLVMAKKKLKSSEYTDWWARHQQIELSLENREKRLKESFAKLESNLTLLGATGIEDRLQDGVPECIASLLAAGIAVWVLTGDKPETAINVAYSAKLFNSQMEILRLTARSRDAAESTIRFFLSEIEKQITDATQNYSANRIKPKALVVDGKTLTFILDLRSNLTRPFLKLTKHCISVLCCRSTPLQKAYLVKIVKEELNLSTLAIGDGANDVSMIQMADVGVGISGQEGMQAVMASDFSLARFRLLERLLLSHGYWCYDRLARMILYFFYKNAAFVFLLFWFQLYCGFSGAVMIDQMYLMLYNLVFTSLPPLAIGVYDKSVPEDLLLTNPYLYKNGRLGLAYKPHTFWVIMLDALYQSLIIFFIAISAYWESDVDIWEFGTTITTSCLITMLIHGAIEIRSWTILHALSIAFSLVSFFLFAMVYNSLCVTCFGLPSTYWVIFKCFCSPIYWLIIFVTAAIAVVPRLLFRTLQTTFFPDDSTNVLLQNKKAKRRESPILGLRIRL
ncbi:phospholipid-transporting ATPase VA isoform X2 [Condylostylus longicornis]|uniref:phospholipid-transporting ATPase VA isoform X2 n=1 Tax=Condylostylus longicornis TaxID=2530218 RepID=UPI00244DD317|nr:phospholipid-transporting ATPase VA isoform X2 [Condylostylus longicornis]